MLGVFIEVYDALLGTSLARHLPKNKPQGTLLMDDKKMM